MRAEKAWVETAWDGDQWVLTAGGRWDLAAVQALQERLRATGPERRAAPVCIDVSGLSALDTAGALLIEDTAERLRGQGHDVEIAGARPDLETLLTEVRRAAQRPVVEASGRQPGMDLLERVGKATYGIGREAASMLNFLGLVSATTARLAVRPLRFRLTPFVFHLEQVGLNAMPIVGLLSFLIGVVLAFQGADQLRQFGAEIFVVNLLGISILREIGVLMTSIIVAGRSGSAFTAQIGTMKVNQEVDAIQTLGLDPVELLVIPRLLALMLALPLLSFFASAMGLLGGALMSYFALGINLGQFLTQLQLAVEAKELFVGLVKAPVFAVVIALVGCYEGLRVSGSAESVGLLTTRSVVVSIFLVIVLDALFSILFSYLGV
ncbi:MlaE family lipid ABC transporter permease subunit [Indioceanicola profundi]|uniref:MlaE family lipid ABC transporter permease subunit n=1 Tax=Indioceanicola profundi TaxID=2220096 RepID=UPI000E6ADE90|nr:MlaE family lipid ABC transporter permease subunit [Indioceanicola profundi]